MGSPTRKTGRRRKMKLHSQGKERKRVARSKGTTRSPEELFADDNK